MLSVLIDARASGADVTALLGQLTSGVVEGLVRQVAIVAAPDPTMVAICEETGADLCPSLEAAATLARSDRLLVLPGSFRFRDGWIGALEAHLAAGGGEAVVMGLATGGGLFRPRPAGVLVEGCRLDGARVADLQRLRRDLGLGARRIG